MSQRKVLFFLVKGGGGRGGGGEGGGGVGGGGDW